MSGLYQGDGVTLRAEFRTVNPDGTTGELYDPGDLRVAVYSSTRQLLPAQPAQASIERVSLGVYQVPYMLPVGHTAIIHEWTGTDRQGHPVRAAATIEDIQWAR